jgi:hypothetical protein
MCAAGDDNVIARRIVLSRETMLDIKSLMVYVTSPPGLLSTGEEVTC